MDQHTKWCQDKRNPCNEHYQGCSTNQSQGKVKLGVLYTSMVNGLWSMVYCFIWLSQQAEAS